MHTAPAEASALAPPARMQPLALFSCCSWFLSVLLGPCPPDDSAAQILPSLINTKLTNQQHPISWCQTRAFMPSSVPAALPKSERIFQQEQKEACFENDGSCTGREQSHSEYGGSSGSRAVLAGKPENCTPFPGVPPPALITTFCFSCPERCWCERSSTSTGKA